MSNGGLARRTEIHVKISGVDVSEDINKYLLQFTYTDHEEDKTDDLQINIDDREGVWLGGWLGGVSDSDTAATVPVSSEEYTTGDIVEFLGGNHYSNSVADTPKGGNRTAGKAKITNIAKNAPHPYHVIGGAYSGIGGNSNVYGWVNKEHIRGEGASQSESAATSSENKTASLTESGESIKGAEISAVIVQENWESDGADRVLDCGVFEIDSLDASGPPTQISIKATSLPYSSTVRTEKKTKAWEKIKLSAIASEIASKNGMDCMFLSAYDPIYTRREQIQTSDIVFLQGLCKDAGISLKVTAKIIVLFDENEYEGKSTIREIKRGEADVTSYRFGTSANDTQYKSSHVIYTDPQTKETIEYTYTPRNAPKDGQTLEINEKVTTREEARQLAMKRLRQKNKAEYSAEFSLVGDVRLVAGVTIDVVGYGIFDGKYIIETATHNVTASGYTTQITLRRVLEDY